MSEEMTKEQARDTLRNAAWLGTDEEREQIEKAVELLCGEPCEELPSAQLEQSEITDEQAIRHLQSTGWMQNHDREMYESGLREKLADDSGSYDSLIPCKDAISRQAAHEAVYSANGLAGAMKNIDALPPVTPKQRTGHWIFEEGDGKTCFDGYVCSACNKSFHTHVPYFAEYEFCPHCGADMRESEEQS